MTASIASPASMAAINTYQIEEVFGDSSSGLLPSFPV
jgi:hypothetical protein